jgi:hypothetical protein
MLEGIKSLMKIGTLQSHQHTNHYKNLRRNCTHMVYYNYNQQELFSLTPTAHSFQYLRMAEYKQKDQLLFHSDQNK